MLHKNILIDPIKKKFVMTIKTIVLLSIILMIVICLYFFPVYRIARLSYAFDYFSKENMKMLVYRGNFSDCVKARIVIESANAAFEDCGHTIEENEEKYGVLSMYATSVDHFEDAYRSTHSIKLWSAHIDDTKGYIWVCISQIIYDRDDNIIFEISNEPALWTIEKNDTNDWTVINVKSHP